jgi:fucose 4-O-acetylase-like acetyltransferase
MRRTECGVNAESSDTPQRRQAEHSPSNSGSTATASYRATAVDAVRVVGIVAVIAGHDWDNTFVQRLVYPWHVPIFFFLTGYLWRSDRSVTAEIRNRGRTLLIPYVAWLAVIAIAYVGVLAMTSPALPLSEVVKAVYGGSMVNRPFSAFWFVTALFFATLMVRMMEKWGHGAAWWVAGVGLLACALGGDKVARAPLAIGVAVPCMIFILAGNWLRERRARITRPMTIGLSLVAVSFTLVFTGISAPLKLKYGDFGLPIVGVAVAIMISAGLLLVFEATFRSLRGAPAIAMTRLAQAGLVVVLSHAVVLWRLNTPPSGSFGAFVLCLVCSWTLGLILIHTPLSPILAGQPRGKRAQSSPLPAPVVDRPSRE